MKIGNREFNIQNETYVMGILNVTPDSFSDGGTHNTVEAALKHTALMIEQGAAIMMWEGNPQDRAIPRFQMRRKSAGLCR